MANKIQLRRDTAANWTTANPILAQGEAGLELDTAQWKAGDGVTAWNSLAYMSVGPQGAQGIPGDTGDTGPEGPPGPPGTEVPTGGTVSQFLTKASSTDYDFVWASITWSDISDKPTEFTPAAHTHTIANVTGLQTALDAKLALAGGSITGSLKAVSYRETNDDLSGTSPTLDCDAANVFEISLTGNTSLSFGNVPAAGTVYSCTLIINAHASNAYTLTFPGTVLWTDGIKPPDPDSGQTDIYTFVTNDGGVRWFAFKSGTDMS